MASNSQGLLPFALRMERVGQGLAKTVVLLTTCISIPGWEWGAGKRRLWDLTSGKASGSPWKRHLDVSISKTSPGDGQAAPSVGASAL